MQVIVGVTSPGGSAVLDELIALARRPCARVRLVLTQPHAARPSGWTAATFAAYARERLARAGVEHEISTADGQPRADAATVRAIADLANRPDPADLVVVAKEAPEDDLPQRLLTAVSASLLVEPAHAVATATPAAVRVLVAIRDEVDLQPAVDQVAALAASVLVQAVVVHVPDLRAPMRGGGTGWIDPAPLVERAQRLLAARGVDARASIPEGSSDAAAALSVFAEKWGATAVVVNSRRGGGWLARFAPSTARSLIEEGSRPVLLTPAS